ncbi:MAG: hypothetical protein ACRD29_06405 [Acidimicrobiales bacterium]
MFRNTAKTAVLLAGLAGLMVAIGSLEVYANRVPMDVPPAQASHFIVYPITGRHIQFAGLFRTHPSTAERVARLRSR